MIFHWETYSWFASHLIGQWRTWNFSLFSCPKFRFEPHIHDTLTCRSKSFLQLGPLHFQTFSAGERGKVTDRCSHDHLVLIYYDCYWLSLPLVMRMFAILVHFSRPIWSTRFSLFSISPTSRTWLFDSRCNPTSLSLSFYWNDVRLMVTRRPFSDSVDVDLYASRAEASERSRLENSSKHWNVPRHENAFDDLKNVEESLAVGPLAATQTDNQWPVAGCWRNTFLLCGTSRDAVGIFFSSSYFTSFLEENVNN